MIALVVFAVFWLIILPLFHEDPWICFVFRLGILGMLVVLPLLLYGLAQLLG